MRYQICSFYDSKLRAYSRPFFIQEVELAGRVAKDVIASENDIARHPEDFAMFHIGEFCDQTAILTPVDPPVCLVRMHEVA